MTAAREFLNRLTFPAQYSRRQQICMIGIFLLTPFMTGCGGGNNTALLPVEGRVLLAGSPLQRGSVSFRPEQGQGWHQPTGLISADGSYILYTDQRAGAPAGQYRVVVFSNQESQARPGTAAPGLPQSLIPNRYNLPELTPLRIDVTADPPTGAYDLELAPDAK